MDADGNHEAHQGIAEYGEPGAGPMEVSALTSELGDQARLTSSVVMMNIDLHALAVETEAKAIAAIDSEKRRDIKGLFTL